jgi:hypothetical protein
VGDRPIAHPQGFTEYAGARQIPPDLLGYRGWTGSHLENRYSHWVWRQYASAFWDDIRIDRILPFEAAKEETDERHVHPLQLDVIDRIIALWSNPNEIVLTPFMGVGSEVYSAIHAGRRAIGIELKATYFRQAVRNMEAALETAQQHDLLADQDAHHVEDIEREDEQFEASTRAAVSRSGRWLSSHNRRAGGVDPR